MCATGYTLLGVVGDFSVYLNDGGIVIGALLLVYERMTARRTQTAG